VVVPANKNVVTIDVVLSVEVGALKEVVVNSRRRYIEQKIDRTVITVEESVSNTGATALDVLRNSPGVTVDQNENILLRSKSGVQISGYCQTQGRT
jgi:hypothetical protein